MTHSPSIIPSEADDLVAWLLNEAKQQERAAGGAEEPYGARISAAAARNLRRAATIIMAHHQLGAHREMSGAPRFVAREQS